MDFPKHATYDFLDRRRRMSKLKVEAAAVGLVTLIYAVGMIALLELLT